MTVKYQKGRGRYVGASEEIPVGTTLLRESPITWALHPERFGSHCQDCLAQVKSVIPCPLCSSVCFCSVACRDRALASYHQYECQTSDFFLLTLAKMRGEGKETDGTKDYHKLCYKVSTSLYFLLDYHKLCYKVSTSL